MILDELLKTIEKSELDEQVKILCDSILEEEKPKFKTAVSEFPKGPNIFLYIELGLLDFLCLEREFKEKYIISHVTTSPYRRIRVWDVTENNAMKILQQFATILKYIRGE